ncbi:MULTISPECIES: hypothetical protein [unclassified Xanthomonas]|uniref:hypothetical protein n=1 Tax=unclassified Xanthomonas TaxID=2643310 RepID=UPI001264F7E3|nr:MULTISPECIES: hypothetical protein [unclassified Xanthomonas]MDY4284599.1 hypothetical protein [Xanthomonas sp. LF06-19]
MFYLEINATLLIVPTALRKPHPAIGGCTPTGSPAQATPYRIQPGSGRIHDRPGTRKEKAAMHDMTWSASEKKAARALFDTALQRELQAYLQEFKRSAASIDTPGALWPLVKQAIKKQREIAQTYDYRILSSPSSSPSFCVAASCRKRK